VTVTGAAVYRLQIAAHGSVHAQHPAEARLPHIALKFLNNFHSLSHGPGASADVVDYENAGKLCRMRRRTGRRQEPELLA